MRFLLLGLVSSTFGQSNLDLNKRLLVKTSPLALFDPETIIIQSGIEYFLTPKWSIQTELGFNGGHFGLPAGRIKNEEFKILRSKNEIKYHFKKFYTGIEFFYVHKDFIRNQDSFFNGSETLFYERSKVNFEVLGYGLKIGRQVFVSNNLLVDSFFGLGARHRHRDVSPIEIGILPEDEFGYRGFLGGERYTFAGWDVVPQFTLGFKIGILTRGD